MEETKKEVAPEIVVHVETTNDGACVDYPKEIEFEMRDGQKKLIRRTDKLLGKGGQA